MEEQFQTLLVNSNLKIERIISKDHSTPPGQWYDQDRDEWVLLLQGNAELQFEDDRILTLSRGDYYLIPAHCRHRVAWTDPDTETIWLAVHFLAQT